MKNKVSNNNIATKDLNSSQNYDKDKNLYFAYYIAGVIILAVFLNLAVKIESTDEYYEKYYVLEEYMNNYGDINNNQYADNNEDMDNNEDVDNNEDMDNNEDVDNSDENNEYINEDDNSHTDIYMNEEY
ncbi:hypothetical protein [Terrisporobacter vanillatitrophus]|uniref:hypothetical protein n=1 Tax=Terrisporobacter vanillatitrophus TaxID=3058402 RepID=UPI003366AFBA